MKKKTVKIISAIMLTILVLASMSNLVLAATTDITIEGKETDASKAVNNIASMILGIVQVVAIAVAVIMLIVLAIKYISSSPEGKADIKKTATLYVVGAVLLFGATGILEVVKKFATEAFKATGN